MFDGQPWLPPAAVTAIYRKTAKGQAEIDTRAHRLVPRLRTALILVDGRRSDDELRKMILAQPDETLAELLEQGFIELVSLLRTPDAARPGPAPSHAADEPAGATAPAQSAPALTGKAFEQFRRDAVRVFTDAVGPMAEALAIKMEKARTHDELRPLLALAMNIILNTRGAGVAGIFSTRFMGHS